MNPGDFAKYASIRETISRGLRAGKDAIIEEAAPLVQGLADIKYGPLFKRMTEAGFSGLEQGAGVGGLLNVAQGFRGAPRIGSHYALAPGALDVLYEAGESGARGVVGKPQALLEAGGSAGSRALGRVAGAEAGGRAGHAVGSGARGALEKLRALLAKPVVPDIKPPMPLPEPTMFERAMRFAQDNPYSTGAGAVGAGLLAGKAMRDR